MTLTRVSDRMESTAKYKRILSVFPGAPSIFSFDAICRSIVIAGVVTLVVALVVVVVIVVIECDRELDVETTEKLGISGANRRGKGWMRCDEGKKKEHRNTSSLSHLNVSLPSGSSSSFTAEQNVAISFSPFLLSLFFFLFFSLSPSVPFPVQ